MARINFALKSKEKRQFHAIIESKSHNSRKILQFGRKPVMTASISFSTHNASSLVDCDNPDCGNLTHPSIPTCGECLEDGYVVSSRYQRNVVSTRRFFNSGYGN